MTKVAEVKVRYVGNRVYVNTANLYPLQISKPDLERLHRKFVSRLQESRSLSGCEFLEEGEFHLYEGQCVHLCVVLPPPIERPAVQRLARSFQMVADQFWQPYRERLNTARVA